MDYKKMMGYGDKKKVTKKESKPKVNKVLESIKSEFGYKKNLKEGPSYEYKKYAKNIDNSLKGLQKSYLNFYELLRKKGLDDVASDFLDNYKRNIVDFEKKYKKHFRKLM